MKNTFFEKRFFLLVAAVALVNVPAGLPTAAQKSEAKTRNKPVIAFISSRFDAALVPPAWLNAAEIYLADAEGGNVVRVTNNSSGENFPALSPDSRRIIFESDRLRKSNDPLNWASLFVMNVDGSKEMSLVPGNSATWSRDGKSIAYHASASQTGNLISLLPGAAALDSDIFILHVDDFIAKRIAPRNVTNSRDAVDDDPDWSPDGKRIVFTSHAVSDDQSNPAGAEIYGIGPDGKNRRRLTNNNEEERAPDYSPNGKLIVYSCRKGKPQSGRTVPTFEICLMSPDGSNQRRITNNNVAELTVTWAGNDKLIFHRAVGGMGQFQLFSINADGSGEQQITHPAGFSGFANGAMTLSKRTN